MSSISFAAAFLGGLLALVSPCSALLLPAFFAYTFVSPSRLLARTAVFYAGLGTTLVPLGAAGSFAGRLFYGHRDAVVAVGGWTIIALGVAQLLGLGFTIGFAGRAAGRFRADTAVSAFLLGMVYGVAGFCAGPILGSILTVAAVGGDPVTGGALLAVYALGMVVPLFVMALLWDRLQLGRKRWLRGRELSVGRLRLHTNSLLSGLLFVLLGAVFLLFDGTSSLPELLSTDTVSRLEERAEAAGSALPNPVLALLLGAVLLGSLGWRLLRRPASERSDARSTSDSGSRSGSGTGIDTDPDNDPDIVA